MTTYQEAQLKATEASITTPEELTTLITVAKSLGYNWREAKDSPIFHVRKSELAQEVAPDSPEHEALYEYFYLIEKNRSHDDAFKAALNVLKNARYSLAMLENDCFPW